MTILRAWTGVGAFLHGGALLVFVLFVVLGISNAYDDGEGVVTCGSIVKLRDSQTGVNLRSLQDITSVHSLVGNARDHFCDCNIKKMCM